MNKSESIKNIAAALCEVQSEIRGYKEDSNNPFYDSKYGDLTSVWAAIRKPLAANGLSIVQTIEHCEPMQALPEMKNKKGEVLPPPGDPVTIETILMHKSGEWISGKLEIRADRPGPQAIGIAITYGRRYSLAAIVGIAPEDDDAEGATNHDQQTKQTKPKATARAKPGARWYDSLWGNMKKAKVPDLDKTWKLLIKQADFKTPKEFNQASDQQCDKFRLLVEEEIKAHKEAS